MTDKGLELLERAVNAGGVWTLGEVMDAIANGEMQVWRSPGAVAVTATEEHASGKAVTIVFGAGALKELQQLHQDIEVSAREDGAVALFINGRKGWERALPGYRVHTVVLRKEL